MTHRQAADPAPGPLEAYAQQFDDRFSKVNQREAFRRYLEGLLLPTERNKTLTALANAEPMTGAHDAAVQALQWFLSESTPDAAAVTARRVDLLRTNPATAPDTAGVLVQGETGDRTWGTRTAHVGRQYLGSIGKVDSGVVTVRSLWADERVSYPLTVEPFTPTQHCALAERDPAYRTKPPIAVEAVTHAVTDGLPVRAVVADSFSGENDTFRTGLAHLGVGDVLALRPAHAWWAPVGVVNSLVDAAHAAAWDGPEAPGDWQPVVRTFRDGHTEPWWALEVTVGPYGPDKQHRVVIATTDPATLPDHTTWYVLTNLPAPGLAPATTDLPAADLAEVVRLYGLRNWVEQSDRQVKYALGWNAYQVRKDHAMRRHWALVCCAFRFCWGASGDAILIPVDTAPPPARPAEKPARGEHCRRSTAHTLHPADHELASGTAAGPSMVGALGAARALLARLVGTAPTAAAPGLARLARAWPSHQAL